MTRAEEMIREYNEVYRRYTPTKPHRKDYTLYVVVACILGGLYVGLRKK